MWCRAGRFPEGDFDPGSGWPPRVDPQGSRPPESSILKGLFKSCFSEPDSLNTFRVEGVFNPSDCVRRRSLEWGGERFYSCVNDLSHSIQAGGPWIVGFLFIGVGLPPARSTVGDRKAGRWMGGEGGLVGVVRLGRPLTGQTTDHYRITTCLCDSHAPAVRLRVPPGWLPAALHPAEASPVGTLAGALPRNFLTGTACFPLTVSTL